MAVFCALQHASVRLCKVLSIYGQRLGCWPYPMFHILRKLQKPQPVGCSVKTTWACACFWRHLAVWAHLLPSALLNVLPAAPCSKQTQVSFERMSTYLTCDIVLHEPFGACSCSPFPFVDCHHGKVHLFWLANQHAGCRSNLQPEILAAEPSVGLLGGL